MNKILGVMAVCVSIFAAFLFTVIVPYLETQTVDVKIDNIVIVYKDDWRYSIAIKEENGNIRVVSLDNDAYYGSNFTVFVCDVPEGVPGYLIGTKSGSKFKSLEFHVPSMKYVK